MWTFAERRKDRLQGQHWCLLPNHHRIDLRNQAPIYTRILIRFSVVYTAATVEFDVDGTDNTSVGVSINPKGPGMIWRPAR